MSEKERKQLIAKRFYIVILILAFFAILGRAGTYFHNMYFTKLNNEEPAAPAVSSADFPITIVYELNGRTVSIDDIAFCKHTGSISKPDSYYNSHNNYPFRHSRVTHILYQPLLKYNPKYRNWEMSFKNNGDEIIICEISNEEYIAIDIGYTAAYLMGDTSHHSYDDCTFKCKPYIVFHTEKTHSKSYISDSEMLEKYGIQIISFKIAPPIENSFG